MSMRARLLHTADWHLGSSYLALGPLAAKMKIDALATFADYLEQTDNLVDIHLIAGDFIESDEINRDEILQLKRILSKARRASIVLVAGNHDPLVPGGVYDQLGDIDNFHILSSAQCQRLDFPNLDLSIYGQSFAGNYQKTSLLDTLDLAAGLGNKLVLMHGDLLTGGQESLYNPMDKKLVDRLPVAYCALGHIHKSNFVQDQESNRLFDKAYYPGSALALSFNELGPRQAIYLEVSDNKLLAIQGMSLEGRQFIEQTVDVTGLEESRSIADRVLSVLGEDDPDYRNQLYRINLAGTVSSGIDLEAVTNLLAAELFYVKLRDKSKPVLDLDSLSQETGLKGYFVRACLAHPEWSDNEEIREAMYLGLEAFEDELANNWEA